MITGEEAVDVFVRTNAPNVGTFEFGRQQILQTNGAVHGIAVEQSAFKGAQLIRPFFGRSVHETCIHHAG